MLDFEVALASGDLTRANGGTNSDLFKALKGGSNNFGVVTAFTMRVFPQQDIWGGTVVSDISTLPKHLEIFHGLAATKDLDPNAIFLTAAGHHYQYGRHAFNSLKYTAPTSDAPVFKEYLSQPILRSTMRIGKLNDMITEEGAFTVSGLRYVHIEPRVPINGISSAGIS